MFNAYLSAKDPEAPKKKKAQKKKASSEWVEVTDATLNEYAFCPTLPIPNLTG